MPAWQEMDDDQEYFSAFDRRFHFHPDVDPDGWPAIREPTPSVTFRVQTGVEPWLDGMDLVNGLVLEAFRSVFAPGTRLVALNWNHYGHWFWPHEELDPDEGWYITPYPNGDYHIFFDEGMDQGIFGHPWESSLCVFGPALVEDLGARLGQHFPVLRSRTG